MNIFIAVKSRQCTFITNITRMKKSIKLAFTKPVRKEPMGIRDNKDAVLEG